MIKKDCCIKDTTVFYAICHQIVTIQFFIVLITLKYGLTGHHVSTCPEEFLFIYKPMICTLKCFVKVFLIIKNNIVKEIIFLALYVVWLFVSVVIILAACTISIVSAIPAAVISITSVSLVGNTVFAAAAVF